MGKILLSINPEHVENILNGSKKVEYRKAKCRSDVDKIFQFRSPIVHISITERFLHGLMILYIPVPKVYGLRERVPGGERANLERDYHRAGR